MNFVRTRLLLDKLAPGDRLLVTLDRGEPAESVSTSVEADGHLVELVEELSEVLCRLTILKV
ncbi:MAG: sulfurtransferase TusA family protein [Candidatus Obscuribacterales bacterium]|nr:sulfurtransferase TusA family protein [Candidatus Obscuribacterales bacterium]